MEEKIWSGKARFEQERGMNKGMKCSLDGLSEKAAAHKMEKSRLIMNTSHSRASLGINSFMAKTRGADWK